MLRTQRLDRVKTALDLAPLTSGDYKIESPGRRKGTERLIIIIIREERLETNKQRKRQTKRLRRGGT